MNDFNQNHYGTGDNVMKFGPVTIELSEDNRNFLKKEIPSKESKIHVSLQAGGSSELTQLAQDIKQFFIASGYSNVQGVNTIMGFDPFMGVQIEKKSDKEFVVFMGSLS